MPQTEKTARQDWVSLLAKADPGALRALMPGLPQHEILRGPEIGTVMVRGRTNGTGAPFNLGEMTVTRCSARLACGAVGHAMVQGRDRDHALRAALGDALMQTGQSEAYREATLAPLQRAATEARQTRAAKAAATRVEFFTLVRGEDK
ncbi:phosphonate C-P lyase system protein PhnG [Pseudogemmobacter faecipullorum]|uniref:Phosphonate C-P lyase system protein PhnG n=1 Tax=Pseudogemmobacter faecipullorum TaxID=2755041 RepID=A0ABS8CS38_9RHOB|nr:phosphonate C-P lyase system protein PhnG [Pseudogemmobacter faecipullorum]MCB5412219.1 phosphonate C-P lyase system protein PhnG [Pseudogemmobacter faecipullorum]